MRSAGWWWRQRRSNVVPISPVICTDDADPKPYRVMLVSQSCALKPLHSFLSRVSKSTLPSSFFLRAAYLPAAVSAWWLTTRSQAKSTRITRALTRKASSAHLADAPASDEAAQVRDTGIRNDYAGC